MRKHSVHVCLVERYQCDAKRMLNKNKTSKDTLKIYCRNLFKIKLSENLKPLYKRRLMHCHES